MSSVIFNQIAVIYINVQQTSELYIMFTQLIEKSMHLLHGRSNTCRPSCL